MGRVTNSDSEIDAPVRFCTLADARYYLGLVALVNSLRLQGHDDPIRVLDLGLTAAQRATLAPECEFLPVPPGRPRHPWLLEPVSCLGALAEVVVYIDADIIVARPLHELIERARIGRVVVFPDSQPARWFAEWSGLFELSAPLRHETYVNAGFLAVSTRRSPVLLQRWAHACELIIGRPTARDDPTAMDSPLGLSSQDALNALLMSEVPAVAIDLQPFGAEAHRRQLPRVKVRDVQTLECTFEDSPTTLLHHWGEPKPWDYAARGYTVNAYSTCLRRLLAGKDVAVQINPREVPCWLRPGLRGAVAHFAVRYSVPAARWLRARFRRPRPQPEPASAAAPVAVDTSNR